MCVNTPILVIIFAFMLVCLCVVLFVYLFVCL